MRLVLSRITDPQDFHYLVPIQFRSFHADGSHSALLGASTPLGPVSPASIPHAIDIDTKSFNSDTSAVWLKVVDEDASTPDYPKGRPVSMALWNLYPNFNEEEWTKQKARFEKMDASGVKYYDSEKEKEDACAMSKKFFEIRMKHTKHRHILLSLLFTDPEYKGKGAGRMLVNYGTQIADQLMLPCWVEASKEGRPLYASCGFEVVEQIYMKTSLPIAMDYPIMRRPVKVAAMEGKTLDKRLINEQNIQE